MDLEKSASGPHFLLADVNDGNPEGRHGVEDSESELGATDCPLALQDLLQRFGVDAAGWTFTGHDSLQEGLAGQALGTRPARRVHEDVRIQQDHFSRPRIDSSFIV